MGKQVKYGMERRRDIETAGKVDDALRASGTPAVARALAHQGVTIALALRILTGPTQRHTAR
jgi:hypothetical protein